MNSIDIRTEKANANFRHRNLQKLTTLLRLIEICVFLVAIFTCSSQFPSFSVKISVDYFKGITFASFSPRFVFVIGNVIVIILLLKSRVAENGGVDVYNEYVKQRCENSQSDGRIRRKLKKSVTDCGGETSLPEICRSSEKMINDDETLRKLTRSVTERGSLKNVQPPDIYRTQSEKMMSTECNEAQIRRKLTQSVTDCGGDTPLPGICRSSKKMINDGQIRRNQTRSVTDCGGETLPPEIYWSQSEIMELEHDDCQSGRKLTRSITERGILNTALPPDNITMQSVTERGILKNAPSPEICRSQSEKMMRVECNDDQIRLKLRRSVTDCSDGETPALESCGVDELSSEAFRRTVEAFIAKQQQSLREEELAPVPNIC